MGLSTQDDLPNFLSKQFPFILISSSLCTLSRKDSSRRFREKGLSRSYGHCGQCFFGSTKAAQDGSPLPFYLGLISISCCPVTPMQWCCHVWQPVAGIKVETDTKKSKNGTTTASRNRRWSQLKHLLQKYVKKQTSKQTKNLELYTRYSDSQY